MVSLIAPPFTANFHKPTSNLNSPSCIPVVFVTDPLKLEHPLHFKKQQIKQKKQLFGFSGVVRKCKNWEGESDPSLELEVLEFMKNSRNPKMFPSKRELIDGGRRDLVDAIMRSGGWMTVGWEDVIEEEIRQDGLVSDLGFWLGKYGKNGFENGEKSGSRINEETHFAGNSFLGNSSLDASYSGRSLEVVAEDDGGVEGILQRLERQRNLSFGSELGKNGSALDYNNGGIGDDNQNEGTKKDVDSCHPQRSEAASFSHDRSLIGGNGLSRSHSDRLSSSLKMDAWRTWSIQRAGFSDTGFEAGEIDYGEYTKRGTADNSKGEIVAITTDIKGAQDMTKDCDSNYKEVTHGDLKTRLQHLEVELSSALRSLRSNTTDFSGKAMGQLSEDLRQLSDVSEFQENEMMNAQDKLRTLRAKLAVLEGKMSLALTDAQHILDEKQKRINDARKTLQLLRTTCIVWPNPGSEVLLAGSFDGWATQRKMTRSSTGIFSLSLKLYPGKYEIKFIVDGVWKVDPLRPIVNNSGFENNLLMIT